MKVQEGEEILHELWPESLYFYGKLGIIGLEL
jgi:hypothetical protein